MEQDFSQKKLYVIGCLLTHSTLEQKKMLAELQVDDAMYSNPLHYDKETKTVAEEKFNRVAKELAEDIKFGYGYITWIGSELGTLRLYRAYDQKRTTQGYSENLKMFYFTLEF